VISQYIMMSQIKVSRFVMQFYITQVTQKFRRLKPEIDFFSEKRSKNGSFPFNRFAPVNL